MERRKALKSVQDTSLEGGFCGVSRGQGSELRVCCDEISCKGEAGLLQGGAYGFSKQSNLSDQR